MGMSFCVAPERESPFACGVSSHGASVYGPEAVAAARRAALRKLQQRDFDQVISGVVLTAAEKSRRAAAEREQDAAEIAEMERIAEAERRAMSFVVVGSTGGCVGDVAMASSPQVEDDVVATGGGESKNVRTNGSEETLSVDGREAVELALAVSRLEKAGGELVEYAGLGFISGYRYLLAFNPDYLLAAVRRCGRFPQLKDLFEVPHEWLKTDQRFSAYGWMVNARSASCLSQSSVHESHSSGSLATSEVCWGRVLKAEFSTGLTVCACSSDQDDECGMVDLGVAADSGAQLWSTPPLAVSDLEKQSLWTPIQFTTTVPGAIGVWHMDPRYYKVTDVEVRVDGVEYRVRDYGGLSVEFVDRVHLDVRAPGMHMLGCRVFQFDPVSGLPVAGARLRDGIAPKLSFWAKASRAVKTTLRVGGGLDLREWMTLHIPGFEGFKAGRMDVITVAPALLPVEGKNTLCVLETLGSAALVHAFARGRLGNDGTVGMCSDEQLRVVSDDYLALLFVRHFSGMCSYSVDVDSVPGSGARALEAIIGATDEVLGDDGVDAVLAAIGF